MTIFFFAAFSKFRHFLCPIVASHPFHAWPERRLNPRTLRGVSVTPLATRSTPLRMPRKFVQMHSGFRHRLEIVSSPDSSVGIAPENIQTVKNTPFYKSAMRFFSLKGLLL
jgi:hypothetical protein